MTPWNWKSFEPDRWSTGWGPLILEIVFNNFTWIWKVKIAREVCDWEIIGEGICTSLQEAQINSEKFAANWIIE